MSVPERRFSDAEVAAIIERATHWKDPRPEPVAPGEGLTLGQLQDIGREIGIAPKVMADAADVLKDGGTTVIRRFLGLPLRIERSVKLRRRFSEDEWEHVVADLREIFNAAGVLEEDGSLRRWSNGNLQVVLEVNAISQRIRLRTFSANALVLVGAGSGICGAASGALITMLWNTAAPDTRLVSIMALMVAVGAALVGVTALSLGPWARRRHAQMAEVAARAIALDRSEPENNLGSVTSRFSH
jgi:hypothetical protein